MDQEAIAALRRRIDTHDVMLRGDGNGNPGLATRVRILEGRDKEVSIMLREWESTKNQLKGVRLTLIVVGIILSALGGSLGFAILETLRRLAADLP